MYIDSHAHFDLVCKEGGFAESEVLDSMAERRVSRAVQISVDAGNFEWCRGFAARNRNRGIFFTTGIHPSSQMDESCLDAMSKYTGSIAVEDMDIFFGIGECGLDYYHKERGRGEQIRAFEHQIDLAKKMKRPVIVHTRDAWSDTLEILRRTKPERGIIHCFSGDAEAAKQAIDMGFYISFAGNVTYKKAVNLHEAARFIPLERMLLETDAPFLSPVPRRGKPNRPEYVKYSYEFVASLRGEDVSAIEAAVSANFERIVEDNRNAAASQKL